MIPSLRLSAFLISALAWCAGAVHAEDSAGAPVAGPLAAAAPASVTVLARLPRPYANLARMGDPARASSCLFMESRPWSRERYGFGMGHAIASIDHWGHDGLGMEGAFADRYGFYGNASGCGRGDRLEASSRLHIALNDRTWADGMAAWQRQDYALAYQQFMAGYNKLGYPEHGYMAGFMQFNGQGMARDPQAAIAWFEKVGMARPERADRVAFDPRDPHASGAMVDALLALAQIYLSGKEVPARPELARRYLQRAADLGYVPAELSLAHLLAQGGADAPDPQRARQLVEHAAKAGYPQAQLAQARLLDQAGDAKGALALYRSAAVRGQPEAVDALASYFYKGELVERNLATARGLYQAAGERGHPQAMASLAAMLYKGEGGGADPAAAYGWLLVAERAGNPDAAKAAKVVLATLSPDQARRVEQALGPVLAR